MYYIWGLDATREITTSCTLNEMHLLFLLIARLRLRTGCTSDVKLGDCITNKQVVLYDKSISTHTLRELFDTVNNLQSLWRGLIATEDTESLYTAVDACVVRFGFLADTLHSPQTLDHSDMVDVVQNTYHRVSNMCIRRFSGFFYVAYRHLHLASCCIELDYEQESFNMELHSHLVSASLDDFYKLSMYYDTTMASILQYRHEFTGMFHSISQVMFYNNSTYVRRKQLTHDCLLMGDTPDHSLPLIQQLYPDIRTLYEDDPFPEAFGTQGTQSELSDDTVLPSQSKDWVWIVVPGRVYLACSSGHLFFCANIIPMVNMLCKYVVR